MRLAILALIACLLAGCTTPPAPPAVASDPIDRLVANLSATRGMWNTGIFSNLGLPQTASPEDVIQRIFSMGLLQPVRYKIVQIRQVHIPIAEIAPDLYTAALMRTDSGEKIVLFKYAGPAVGWWSRVYDAKTLGVTAAWS
jgi:hypothetical protein